MKKSLILSLIALFTLPFAYAEEQSICPIMVEDEIDQDEVVEFEGKKIYMCCGGCVKAWNLNPKYYLKVARELKLVPQFASVSPELEKELAGIELMKQRFCPLRPTAVVSPTSPSIEYKGKKIYFFKERDITRKWERNPEAAFEKAKKAGLLPQFD
jgi:YHS domain-containing protein